MLFDYFPQPITARILGEASIVGILLIIFTYFVSFILHHTEFKPTLPTICNQWNKNHIMEITLFISGFLFHLTFEFLGWNKMYAIDKVKY
jgi:hypothetical protein